MSLRLNNLFCGNAVRFSHAFCLAAAAMLAAGDSAHAAVIVSATNDLTNWGSTFSNITPDGETGARDLRSSRDIYQSFRLDNAITDITEVQIGAIFTGSTGATFDVNFYAITDFEDTGFVSNNSLPSTSLASFSVSNTASPGPTSGFGYTSLSLTDGDVFDLPAGHYAVRVNAGSASTAWMKWDAINGGGNVFGSATFVDTGATNQRDFSIGLIGTTIPEPTALTLVGLAGLAAAARRRAR